MTHPEPSRALIVARIGVAQLIGYGGSYYLPYRPHARPDQFHRAYPRAAQFAARKRELDPGLVLRNALWDNYLGV